MTVNNLKSEPFPLNHEGEKVTSIFDYMDNRGGTEKLGNDLNKSIDSKDLKMLDQKLTNKIDVSETKLSGKIDTVEAKMSGRMDVLDTKLSSLDDKIATQTKRMDWLIALVIGSILVPIFIKLFVK